MKHGLRRLCQLGAAIVISIVYFTTDISVFHAAEVAGEPFIVGMECAYAPNNWTSVASSETSVDIGGGQYCDGFDVMMSRRIADGLGRPLVVKKTSWDGLIPSLHAHEIDAIIAGMSPTLERRKEIAFSDTYFSGKFGVMVHKEGQYANGKTVADFSGARLSAQLGTFHVDLIDQLTGADKLQPMKDFPAMTVAAKAQEIDGFVADSSTGLTIAAQNPELAYIILEGDYGFEIREDLVGTAVGLRKEDDTLVAQINEILSTMSMADREGYMEAAIAAQPGADDTPEEKRSFFGQVANLWSQYGTLFMTGTFMTLLIATVSTFLGILLGLLMAIFRHSSKIGKYLVLIYVTVIRGTPMMVQAVLIFYGTAIAFRGFQWSNIPYGNIVAGLIIVTINTGAYMAETIRSGIQALDEGQFEAAKSLGFTRWQTMIHIILPQAVRNVLPALGNEFIVNIKDSSVLNVISVSELFFMSSSVSGATYQFFQTFTITALIYLVLTTVFSLLLSYVERYLGTQQKKPKRPFAMLRKTKKATN